AHIEPRLAGDSGGVWAHEHIVEFQQRVVARRRLGRPDVETCARQPLLPQRVRERRLVVDMTPRRPADKSTRATQGELRRADQPAGLRSERAVDRYVVAAAHQVVENDLFGAAFGAHRSCEIRVVSEYVHGEQAAAKLSKAAADIAEPDDAD